MFLKDLWFVFNAMLGFWGECTIFWDSFKAVNFFLCVLNMFYLIGWIYLAKTEKEGRMSAMDIAIAPIICSLVTASVVYIKCAKLHYVPLSGWIALLVILIWICAPIVIFCYVRRIRKNNAMAGESTEEKSESADDTDEANIESTESRPT